MKGKKCFPLWRQGGGEERPSYRNYYFQSFIHVKICSNVQMKTMDRKMKRKNIKKTWLSHNRSCLWNLAHGIRHTTTLCYSYLQHYHYHSMKLFILCCFLFVTHKKKQKRNATRLTLIFIFFLCKQDRKVKFTSHTWTSVSLGMKDLFFLFSPPFAEFFSIFQWKLWEICNRISFEVFIVIHGIIFSVFLLVVF